MTVRELREFLDAAPEDATVEMAIWDDGWNDTDVDTVTYDSVTNKVTLTEAS